MNKEVKIINSLPEGTQLAQLYRKNQKLKQRNEYLERLLNKKAQQTYSWRDLYAENLALFQENQSLKKRLGEKVTQLEELPKTKLLDGVMYKFVD